MNLAGQVYAMKDLGRETYERAVGEMVCSAAAVLKVSVFSSAFVTAASIRTEQD